MANDNSLRTDTDSAGARSAQVIAFNELVSRVPSDSTDPRRLSFAGVRSGALWRQAVETALAGSNEYWAQNSGDDVVFEECQ